MHVAIVYESLFGNTRQVAEAIGEGVRAAHPDAEIDCLRVDEADPEGLGPVDLLVVGGPTHIHGMSSGFSRKMGVESERKKIAEGQPVQEPEPGAEGPGVRSWLQSLPKAGSHPHGAAFDTRAAFPTSGGAAHGIARRLRRHGYDVVAEPIGFVVEGADGPLRTGELDRARAWGSELTAKDS